MSINTTVVLEDSSGRRIDERMIRCSRVNCSTSFTPTSSNRFVSYRVHISSTNIFGESASSAVSDIISEFMPPFILTSAVLHLSELMLYRWF